MINRIVILGGGSAGFLAALAIKSKLRGVEVVVIRSKDIGIIGVGEGSTPALTRFLHEYVGIIPKKFFEIAQPTWKLGLRFIWGPRPYFNYTFGQGQLAAKVAGLPKSKAFYCDQEMEYEDPLSALMSQDRVFERGPNGRPLFHPNIAYHFENEKFVRFLEGYATALGVTILDDTVTDVERDESGGVAALRLGSSGRREAADLFVDASGFASLLLGRTLKEPFVSFDRSLFCDRAVIGGWDRTTPEDQTIKPYTTCETMDSGWCWQIEHEGRINRGYVYCSAFISDADAEREFRTKNPKIGPPRVVKFVSGRYQNLWVNNVVAVGNAGGFVEPLEATALGMIAFQSRTLVDTLIECDGEVTPSAKRSFNHLHASLWDDIRDFLSVHYRFNTRLDTPFWRHCRAETDLAGAAGLIETYRENGPTMWLEPTIDRSSQFGVPGYLAMLLGQRVEHRPLRAPTAEETRTWEAERQRYRKMAMSGLSVRETLAAIRSPKWEWRNG
ncbi:MAG TPA: tryptophan halogenase family protein [Tepidisphaeraceae bacterium]|jgi:tryptophan halogenase